MQDNSVALQLAEQFSASADRLTGDELFDHLRTGGKLGADLRIWFFKDEHDLRQQLPQLAHLCVKDLLANTDTPPMCHLQWLRPVARHRSDGRAKA